MAQELTIEYNMENWKEATKDWRFMTYSTEKYGEVPGTLYLCGVSPQNESYSRANFERDLKKVSRKR